MTRMNRALSQASLRLLSIVGRTGGATAAEALREMPRGLCNDTADRLSTLCDRGHIARRMDGRHWRYFGGREAAEAWEAEQMLARGEQEPVQAEYFRPAETFAQEWARLRGGVAA